MFFPYFKVLKLSILKSDKYGFSLVSNSVYFLALITMYCMNFQRYGYNTFRMRLKPQEDKQLASHLSNIGNLRENIFYFMG